MRGAADRCSGTWYGCAARPDRSVAARMEMKVNEESRSQTSAIGKQPARQVERYSVEKYLEQATQTHFRIRHQGERREKMTAELSVRHPWTPFLIALERGDHVNEHGTSVQKLHVVGA